MTEQNLNIDLESLPDLLEMNNQAIEIITKSTAKASAAAAIPLPLVDIGGITYVQIRMVKKLAAIYGVDTESTEKLLLSTVVSSICAALISEAITSLTASTKLEKVIGESLIKASIAGIITTITGEVYTEHFAKGGNLQDINLDTYIDYAKNQLSSERFSTEALSAKMIDTVMNKFSL